MLTAQAPSRTCNESKENETVVAGEPAGLSSRPSSALARSSFFERERERETTTLRSTDYSQVDILASWYKFVNFGLEGLVCTRSLQLLQMARGSQERYTSDWEWESSDRESLDWGFGSKEFGLGEGVSGRVQGGGCRMQGAGCRVQGAGRRGRGR